MPAIDRFADLDEHLFQGVGLGDAVPAIEGRADDDCFEAERIEQARKVLIERFGGAEIKHVTCQV